MKIYLMGGLGNNIFQVLATLDDEHQVEYNSFLQLRNAITRLLGWTIHENVIEQLFDLKVIKPRGFLISEGLDIILLSCSKILGCKVLSRNYMIRTPSAKEIINSTTLGGYMHPVSLEQFNLLSNKRHFLKVSLERVNQIGVHIRRGDLGDNTALGLLDSETFNKVVKKEISYSGYKVVVYTNDKGWCQRNLTFDYEFSQSLPGLNPVVSDFIGLASSATLICSNSTFSYTAAMLGCNERVLVPSPFFKSENIYVPDKWISFLAEYE
jgi:hypothetical protein